MIALGCPPLYLPHMTASKPDGKEPHLAIYCTPRETLKEKKDIIVIANNSGTDLGVWSYRHLLRSGGLDGGSCISLAKALQAGTSAFTRFDANRTDTPGLVILNPGQLLYSHRQASAQTHTSWVAQPRASAAHPPPRIHPTHNVIHGHASPDAHVATVFAALLRNPAFVSPAARLYIVGLADGARAVLACLDDPAAAWLRRRVAALALVQPTHAPTAVTSAALRALLAARGRAFVLSRAPRGALLGAPWVESAPNEWGHVERVDCPVYASGVADVAESIFGMEAGRALVLGWLGEVKWADAGMKAPANLWGVLETSGNRGRGYENEKGDVEVWKEDVEDSQVGAEGDGMEYGQVTEDVPGSVTGDMTATNNKSGEKMQTAETGIPHVEAVDEGENEAGLTEQTRGFEGVIQPDSGREKVRIADTEVDKDLLVRAGLL